VKCRRVRDLISPYLDQQLTGAEMLEMERHLRQCESCSVEWQTISEVKRMMRSLCVHQPEGPLDERIMMRIARARTTPAVTSVPVAISGAAQSAALLRSLYLMNRPRHPRRLAAALALSCIAIFTVAAPFAPSISDETLHTASVGSGSLSFWSAIGRPQIPAAGVADGSLAEPAGYVEAAPAGQYASARSHSVDARSLFRQSPRNYFAPVSVPTLYASSPNGYNSSYVEMAGFQP
jgi:anti-sigma factor RsiW